MFFMRVNRIKSIESIKRQDVKQANKSQQDSISVRIKRLRERKSLVFYTRKKHRQKRDHFYAYKTSKRKKIACLTFYACEITLITLFTIYLYYLNCPNNFIHITTGNMLLNFVYKNLITSCEQHC